MKITSQPSECVARAVCQESHFLGKAVILWTDMAALSGLRILSGAVKSEEAVADYTVSMKPSSNLKLLDTIIVRLNMSQCELRDNIYDSKPSM